jgi:hypothetical protein
MFLTYDEAKGYSESELKAMGLFPAGNGNWMDADTAIGLGYPATAFGTGGILQMQGYDVNALNRIISAQNTANFNRDYSPGGAFYNDPAATPAITTTPTETQKTDSEGGLWNWIVDKATGIGNWIKENPATSIGAGAGLVTGVGPTLALGGKAIDSITDKIAGTDSKTINKVDTSLSNYFGDLDKAEQNYKIDNYELSPSGNLATVDQMNTWMNTDPYANIKIGDTGTPSGEPFDTKTISGLYGNGNIDTSNMDFLNSTGTITPSYGSDVSITGDIAKNISNSMSVPNGVVGSTLNETETPVNNYGLGTSESDIFNSTAKTAPNLTGKINNVDNTPAQIDSSIIANALRNSPLNQNQNTGDVFKNEITNQIPNTPIVSGTETTAPTSSTNTTGFSIGELPQMRGQLNRALMDAKNAAIMRGTPLTQDEISGAVKGIAEGATGRLNEAQRIQLIKEQMATAKDQWERGFITEKEYNDRVLALQEKYAELGYKADADFLKKSEKNQDWGNIIGTLSLLDDLWG